ncbi:MAG: hypothetical protein ABR964_04025 [Tepidisphaeraceae bacterium]
MRNGTCVILACLTVGCMAAAQPATQPAALTATSGIDQILDALDARGHNLQDFTAVVRLSDTDNSTGDSAATDGKVLFQRKGDGDARIRVAFNKKERGDQIFDVDHQYTLDDGWLVERDYQAKKEIRNQVLKPGQKMDLLKLGEGPFPLPIGQKKEDVKNLFDVGKIEPAKDDPTDTVHVRLTPRPQTQYARKFKTVDLWVDLASAMPRRIQTLDANETTIKTTDLSEVKINVGLADADFAQPALPNSGWDQIVQPYEQQ